MARVVEGVLRIQIGRHLPTFWEKTTKASDRKLPDGRELLELLPFIVLFVMHRLRRVY